jgi:NitT/TauT family transport system permease protein
VLLAIAVMVVMVVGVNVVFWRPLTAWAETFRTEDIATAGEQRSVSLDLLRRSALPGLAGRGLRPVGLPLDRLTRPFGLAERPLRVNAARRRAGDIAVTARGPRAGRLGPWRMLALHRPGGRAGRVRTCLCLGLVTLARVVVLVVVGSAVWVPIGVWIGMNPKVTRSRPADRPGAGLASRPTSCSRSSRSR